MDAKTLVAAVAAADAAPVDEALTLLQGVLVALKTNPQPGVTALLIRGLGRMAQRRIPGAATALREAEALP